MSRNRRALRKSFSANVTAERFLPGMSPEVSCQIRSLCESFGTQVAFEWSLSGVCSHVCFESRRSSVALATDLKIRHKYISYKSKIIFGNGLFYKLKMLAICI